MVWFYQGCEIAATVFESFVFLDFLTKLLGTKYSEKKQHFLFWIAFILINSYMILFNYCIPEYSAFSDVIVLMLYIIFALIATQNNPLYQIIVPPLTISVILVINLLTLHSFSSAFSVSLEYLTIGRNPLRLGVLFVTKAVFFACTRLVLHKFKPSDVLLQAREYLAVALSFLCSVIIVLYFAEYQIHPSEIQGFYTFIILLCVVLINVASSLLFVAIAKRNRENMRNALLQMQYQEQEKMHSSICSAYRNLQILRHDMKNDLIALQNMVHKGENSEAEEFIQNYTRTKLEQFQIYVTTGNELIDAIMNIKMNYAKEKGIEVTCRIAADFTSFQAADIVSLFSNAMDNAIEASETQPYRHILLTIEHKRSYLCITIGNAIQQSVLEGNSNLQTTKGEKQLHGFGTQSMKNIVEKYDGMLEYFEKNNMFFVNILLRDAKQEEKTTKQE